MGYRIHTHILKHNFNVEKLQMLNKAFGFCVYRLPNFKETFIDIDFEWHDKSDMDEPYGALNTLSETLSKVDPSYCAHWSFNRSFIIMNLNLSMVFKSSLLSIDTDDDLRNMHVESERGNLVKLRCIIADFEILYTGEKVHIYPLILEDDDIPLTDLKIFDHDDFVVHPRTREYYSNLHEIAIQEVQEFLNTDRTVLDLGEADASDYEKTVLYQRTQVSGKEYINRKALKPKWKFW